VHVLSSAPLASSAWSFGGSILTFAFPMILFIVVAGALWILYTKPELVPGHWVGAAERPVSYTPMPGQSAADAGHEAAAEGGQAATAQDTQPAAAEQDQAAPAEQGEARIQDGEAARTEDGE